MDHILGIGCSNLMESYGINCIWWRTNRSNRIKCILKHSETTCVGNIFNNYVSLGTIFWHAWPVFLWDKSVYQQNWNGVRGVSTWLFSLKKLTAENFTGAILFCLSHNSFGLLLSKWVSKTWDLNINAYYHDVKLIHYNFLQQNVTNKFSKS